MWDRIFECIIPVKLHKEKTQKSRSFLSALCRPIPKVREAEELKGQKQRSADAIDPATYKSPSLVLFDPKKDRSFWFRINYRYLTRFAIKNTYPFLRIDIYIDSQGSEKLLSRWILTVVKGKSRWKKRTGTERLLYSAGNYINRNA